jgi:predicted ArsR family transcriptional regulator
MSETFALLPVFMTMRDELGKSPTTPQLANRLRISTTKTAQRLETLAINGYLERTTRPLPGKRRSTVVYYLTKQGIRYVQHNRASAQRRANREIHATPRDGGL